MPAKALYDLAVQFRKEALWKQLSDVDIFAIPLPNKSIAYCCVMGMEEQHFALAVYPGDTGLASLRNMFQRDESASQFQRTERMFSQDCVSVSYEAKGDLPPYSLAEIKAHGLIFRGKNAFPLFQRMRPNYYPWIIDTPADEAMLASALRAGLEVSRRLKTDAKMRTSLFGSFNNAKGKPVLCFAENPLFDQSIPLVTEDENGSFTFSKFNLPAPIEQAYSSPVLEDELLIARVKKIKYTNNWACVQMLFPSPTSDDVPDEIGYVRSPTSAPYFPTALIAVDCINGMLTNLSVAKPDANAALTLVLNLTDAMNTYGRPAKILVPNKQTYTLLSKGMEQIHVQIEIADDLPILDEAIESLLDSLEAQEDSSNDEIEEETVSLLMQMLQYDKIPDSMLEKLRLLYETNMLSDELANKVIEFLDHHTKEN